jgi:hypothetical protein
MRREHPDLVSAFTEFIIRSLADRVESASREIAVPIH